jgi:hypothetical protein
LDNEIHEGVGERHRGSDRRRNVTEIPNLTLHRFDEPTKSTSYLLEPIVCVILQGLSAW